MGKHSHIAHKIKDLDMLLDALKSERAAGKKVVFTNGCFDILHRAMSIILQKQPIRVTC